jgi:hypothetical protein
VTRVVQTPAGHRIVMIEPEPDSLCQECGMDAELRPYGIGGKRICFKCAMKDDAGTTRRMNHVLFGNEVIG